jgi:2-polyprenyl-3-methyl-5-hydroxy-6-metoxy-1,4-benzoquinol methylase
MPEQAISDAERLARHQREQEYFDRAARESAASLVPFSAHTLHRYGALKRRRYSLEYRFRLMGDLRGKKVLDVGCGDGINGVLMAKLGAHVTGVDVSEESIALASRRARVNGVEDRVSFVQGAIEDLDLEPHSFDIVFGDAILHHVIPDLELVVRSCRKWVRPGGLVLLSEPVVLARWLRRFRLSLPVPPEGTPDERPLEKDELDRVLDVLRPAQVRMFWLLSRLTRFLLHDSDNENTAPWRQRATEILAVVDYFLLSIPGVHRLGGTMVIAARSEPAQA